jgi:hypothetical protein
MPNRFLQKPWKIGLIAMSLYLKGFSDYLAFEKKGANKLSPHT